MRVVGGAQPRNVVDDVSFRVEPGETVCVVGESGSGKSVTALSVMGLLPKGALAATGGEIWLDGEELLGASADRIRALRARRMAMVFQEPMTALNPVERVGDQIEEVLTTHLELSRSERRARVLEMLGAVRLPDPATIYRAYPHQLSGGQRQRIVISMALALNPRLMICDEPTTALDVTTQRQILTLIRDLQRQQETAVLFVTHDFGVVQEIADRIVVMQDGRVVESGAREQILSQPCAAYTRSLISSVPSLIPRARPRPAGETILDLRNVTKTYVERRLFRQGRTVLAAKDVSLTLAKGEILGVVGESGSGKSTVARCVVRLIDPDSGEIHLRGTEIARLSRRHMRAHRRHVQIVFQDPYRSLNPRLPVGRSLIEGLVNIGMPSAEALAAARTMLELVGLESDILGRYPHQFSGGQRQRLCLARALALRPDVLVADEAVSSLDVSVQAQVLDLIEDIRRKMGIAVLFITHDLRVAAQICDTIAVMESGRIVESGAAVDVLTRPSNRYTQELIEAAPGRGWDFRNFRPAESVSQ